MKKVLLLSIVAILALMVSSCSREATNMKVFSNNYEEIANQTFAEIISAIQLKDVTKIVTLFSCAAQSGTDLTQESDHLIGFIHGNIVSFSSAKEGGVAMGGALEKDKEKVEIESVFCIETTDSKYYVAIKECLKNDFNTSSVGVHSIYIIDARDWSKDYIYRGDGKWTPGINIASPILE